MDSGAPFRMSIGFFIWTRVFLKLEDRRRKVLATTKATVLDRSFAWESQRTTSKGHFQSNLGHFGA